VDYKFYTNPVAAHPDDWSVAIAIEYKNWSTLDEMPNGLCNSCPGYHVVGDCKWRVLCVENVR
jgi:hypothetical protein